MRLQPAVDDLALRVGRPVLLEDHAQSVLAYSEQTGPMDDVRRDSILRRHTTPTCADRFRAAGIFESRGPLRVPGSAGVLPRVCVPVRHRDRLLGFLWLIDEPAMSEADVALAAKSAAGALALTLLHDALAAGLTAQRERTAVAGCCPATTPTRRAGARRRGRVPATAGDRAGGAAGPGRPWRTACWRPG